MVFTIRRSSALLLMAFGVCGCGQPPGTDALPTWDVVSSLRIGGSDADSYSFNQITSVVLDSDRRIYVADGGDSRIRVYTRRGEHVRDIGGPGDGPGEFRRLIAASVHSDTLYAVDLRLQRVTLFDTAGTVLTTIAQPTHNGAPTVVSNVFSGLTALVIPAQRGADAAPVPRLMMTLSGEVLDTLGTADMNHGTLVLNRTSGDLHITDPFAAPDFLALSGDGRLWAEVSYVMPTREGPAPVRIAVHTTGGGEVWRSEMHFEAVRLLPVEVDSVLTDLAARLASMGVSKADLTKSVQPPEFKPPISAVHVANNGEIWIRGSTASEQTVFWTVLDEHGVAHGRVALPVSARPKVILHDSILAIEKDELDVERVVEYQVVRDRRAAPM